MSLSHVRRLPSGRVVRSQVYTYEERLSESAGFRVAEARGGCRPMTIGPRCSDGYASQTVRFDQSSHKRIVLDLKRKQTTTAEATNANEA